MRRIRSATSGFLFSLNDHMCMLFVKVTPVSVLQDKESLEIPHGSKANFNHMHTSPCELNYPGTGAIPRR